MAGNPTRSCLACGQVDDHPRCTHQLIDGRWVDYHFDCCAATGCEHAQERIKGLKQGSIGDEMRAHLIKKGDEMAKRIAKEADAAAKDAEAAAERKKD